MRRQMARSALRGVLLLCLIANLVGFGRAFSAGHTSARSGLCAGSEHGGVSQWVPSSAGGDLLIKPAPRGRILARVSSPRFLARQRGDDRDPGSVARTPHRLSSPHRHHLRLLAALARDDDSPA